MQVRAEIARVSGRCNAAFQAGDAFVVAEFAVLPQNHSRSCAYLCASVALNAGRLGLENGPIYISCPDPGTGEGGNVIVRLSAVEA